MHSPAAQSIACSIQLVLAIKFKGGLQYESAVREAKGGLLIKTILEIRNEMLEPRPIAIFSQYVNEPGDKTKSDLLLSWLAQLLKEKLVC